MSFSLYDISGVKEVVSSMTGGKDIFTNLTWAGVPLSLALAALPHWYTIYLAESNKVQGGWSNVRGWISGK
uniref:Uncharacterized protein n=1 Tax=Melanopsichium pennsylvanicum 4 TaxID=1398559 RepID=A0A077R368_9BASI|nr:conserved hypothetical protein [Melanopsichium pennsylvanicum 4]